jgi:hypothetical protein
MQNLDEGFSRNFCVKIFVSTQESDFVRRTA